MRSFFGFFCLFVCFLIYFIYLWLCWVFISVRGLSSSYGKRGPLFIVVRGPLTIAASLVAEHRLQTRRLSNCGSRAQLLRGMWDLPRPGLEPVIPALAGRLWTTAPPGKPQMRNSYSNSSKSGLLMRIRVWAGPEFLYPGLRCSPDMFLWFSRLSSCDLLSGMKNASSSS